MAPEAKETLLRLLKQFSPDQPFTVEELTRQYLSEKGLPWQNVHEVEAQGEIDKYLKEQGLVKEYGQTTLYNITPKVNQS